MPQPLIGSCTALDRAAKALTSSHAFSAETEGQFPRQQLSGAYIALTDVSSSVPSLQATTQSE